MEPENTSRKHNSPEKRRVINLAFLEKKKVNKSLEDSKNNIKEEANPKKAKEGLAALTSFENLKKKVFNILDYKKYKKENRKEDNKERVEVKPIVEEMQITKEKISVSAEFENLKSKVKEIIKEGTNIRGYVDSDFDKVRKLIDAMPDGKEKNKLWEEFKDLNKEASDYEIYGLKFIESEKTSEIKKENTLAKTKTKNAVNRLKERGQQLKIKQGNKVEGKEQEKRNNVEVEEKQTEEESPEKKDIENNIDQKEKEERDPEVIAEREIKLSFQNVENSILKRMNRYEGIADYLPELERLEKEIDKLPKSTDMDTVKVRDKYLRKEIETYFSHYKKEADEFDRDRKVFVEHGEKMYEEMKKSRNIEDEDENKNGGEGGDGKDGGNNNETNSKKRRKSPTEEAFGENFDGSDKRSLVEKVGDRYRIFKDKKEILKLNRTQEKDLNYLKNLVGKDKFKHTLDLPYEERRREEMTILENELTKSKHYINEGFAKNLFKKIKERDAEIYKIYEKNHDSLKNIRDKKQYSQSIDRDIQLNEDNIKALKEEKPTGYKDQIKVHKKEIERLKSIPRIRENPFIKYTKEQLRLRERRLDTPEMKENLKEVKKKLFNKLLSGSRDTLVGLLRILVVAPLSALPIIFGKVEAGTENFGANFGEGARLTLEGVGKLLKSLGLTFEYGRRYLIAK